MRALLSVSLLVLNCRRFPPSDGRPFGRRPIATDRRGEAQVNGISIHYRIYGQGSPVIFHGGLANSDY